METTLKKTVHLTATDFKEKVFDYEKRRNGNMKVLCRRQFIFMLTGPAL